MLAGPVQPLLHQALRPGSQGLSSQCPATQDLHEVAQHATVIDNLSEGDRQPIAVAHGQYGAQQCRHILHSPVLATPDRGAGDELRLYPGAQFDRLRQLGLRPGVVSAVEASRNRILRKGMLIAQTISGSTSFVEGIALLQTQGRTGKKHLVSHLAASLVRTIISKLTFPLRKICQVFVCIDNALI